jgi:hypothetical protein
MVVVVDGGVGDVLGSVLHNDGYIRSTPLHQNEEELPWSNDSPKSAEGHRRDDVNRRHRWTNDRADRFLSYVWSRGSAGAYS